MNLLSFGKLFFNRFIFSFKLVDLPLKIKNLLITIADNRIVLRISTTILMLLPLTMLWVIADASSIRRPEAIKITRALSLNKAIQLTLRRNLSIKSAKNTLKAVSAARRASSGKLYPTIKAISWYEIFPTKRAKLIPRTYFNGISNQSSLFQDSIFNIGAKLNWPLYTGGQLTAKINSMRYKVNAANYRLSRMRQQIVFEVIQTYLGILVTKHTEQSIHAEIDYLSEAKSKLETFVKVGEKPRIDLLRIKTRLEQMRQSLADVRVQLVRLDGNLLRLLDLDPSSSPLELTDELSSKIPKNISLSTALRRALINRPDYQALKSGLASRRALLYAAKGRRLPKVDLSARIWEAHGNRTGGPISIWEPDSQITLSVSVPLFTGGLIGAQIDQNEALLEKTTNHLMDLAQHVRWEVTQAYAQLQATKYKLVAAQSLIKSAEEAFRIEREKLVVGAGTITDLLDTQAADLSAKTNFYREEAESQLSLFRFKFAIGAIDTMTNNKYTGDIQ